MRLSMYYRLSPAANQSGLKAWHRHRVGCRCHLQMSIGGRQTYGQLTHSSVPSAKT
jgi:hypothetical protein